MKDAIGYVRVSTQERGRSGVGLAAQRFDIKAFGFSVRAWYQDIQTGAGKDALLLRPGLARDLNAAFVRDPFLTVAIWSLGTAQYGASRFAAADATYRRLLEIAPDYFNGRSFLGKTLLAEGKPEAAVAMVQQANENARQVFLPIVLQAAGRQAESDAALKTLITKFADTQAYYVAMTYAYRGDRALAFQWLDRAYEQRDQGFIAFIGEPLFKNIEGDPRYKAFLKKMNLPEG